MRYSSSLVTAAALLIVLAVLSAPVSEAFSQENPVNKTLILYYSRTNNTKMCCEALQKELGADLLEIKDLKNRAGGWGFFTGAVGSLFNVHTDIDPHTLTCQATGISSLHHQSGPERLLPRSAP